MKKESNKFMIQIMFIILLAVTISFLLGFAVGFCVGKIKEATNIDQLIDHYYEQEKEN